MKNFYWIAAALCASQRRVKENLCMSGLPRGFTNRSQGRGERVVRDWIAAHPDGCSQGRVGRFERDWIATPSATARKDGWGGWRSTRLPCSLITWAQERKNNTPHKPPSPVIANEVKRPRKNTAGIKFLLDCRGAMRLARTGWGG